MCLMEIREQGLNLTGYGYKSVYKNKEGKIRLPFYGVDGDIETNIELGKEYTADEHKIWADCVPEEQYTSGFHIFTVLEDAQKYLGNDMTAIVLVEYREGHTTGSEFLVQNGVVVARYVKFLKEV